MPLSEKTLKNIRKDINLDIIKETLKNCKKLKIKVLASFIIGLPNETLEDFMNTLRFAEKYCDYASFNTFVPRLGAELDSKEGDAELTKKIEKRYYLRAGYILKQLLSIRSLHQIKNMIKNGLVIVKK